MSGAPSRIILLLGMLATGLMAAGCENALDPFADDRSANPFFVHGFLDTSADTQFIRVEPIRRSYDPDAGPLAASVRTTEVESGVVMMWDDSLIVNRDGSDAHLFFARFAPTPGRTYVLDVMRDDGATTSSRVDVPARPLLDVAPAVVQSGSVFQEVAWSGLARAPIAAEVVYEVSESASSVPDRFSFDYAGTLEGQTWTVLARLTADREQIAALIGEPAGSTMTGLHGIQMSVTVLSDEWFSPEEDHVDNGAGFLGAVGRFSETWVLPDDILRRLRYVDRQDPLPAFE